MTPIPEFPNYFVDKLGNVYSTQPINGRCKKPSIPRKLKPNITGPTKTSTYRFVVLMKNRKPYRIKIGKLVLTTFIRKRVGNEYVCHGAKGSLDDSLSNLYWGTPKQNMQDRFRDGTDNLGERNARALVTEEEVKEIRRLFHSEKRFTLMYFANKYNLGKTTVGHIVHHTSWKHI